MWSSSAGYKVSLLGVCGRRSVAAQGSFRRCSARLPAHYTPPTATPATTVTATATTTATCSCMHCADARAPAFSLRGARHQGVLSPDAVPAAGR